jgi:hypothetical protein
VTYASKSAIIINVHKPFYASGFFYHPASQQILLQQQTHGDEVKFVLFRGKSDKGSEPQAVFQQCIEESLGIPVKPSSIRPVYDYIHEKFGAHFIFYVEITDAIPKALTDKEETQWISLTKLSKHKMSEQTRHDIVVGERVIRALQEQKNPSTPTKGWH